MKILAESGSHLRHRDLLFSGIEKPAERVSEVRCDAIVFLARRLHYIPRTLLSFVQQQRAGVKDDLLFFSICVCALYWYSCIPRDSDARRGLFGWKCTVHQAALLRRNAGALLSFRS